MWAFQARYYEDATAEMLAREFGVPRTAAMALAKDLASTLTIHALLKSQV